MNSLRKGGDEPSQRERQYHSEVSLFTHNRYC